MAPGRPAMAPGRTTRSRALLVPSPSSNPGGSTLGKSPTGQEAKSGSSPSSNPGGSTPGRTTSGTFSPPTSNSDPGEMVTKTMPPGRKAMARPRQHAAAPMTEYEKLRDQNIMRNNQVFESLNIAPLVSLLKNAFANVVNDCPQKSGSEYNPCDNEGLEDDDEVISKNANICSQGTQVSKRVMAPRMQLEHRVTRQRSAATTSLTASAEDVLATPSGDDPIQTEDLNPTADEDALAEVTEQGQGRRGRSIGKDLDRITRGLRSKICIQVSEGKKRPEAPLQAAKLASEAGIVLRQHVPIFTHWKHYKENEPEIANFIGKVSGQFNMDTENKAVKDACVDLLKGGQRQRRYNLKSKYFNGRSQDQVRRTSPMTCMSDAEWLKLVDMWSSSAHKDKCAKNKINRDCVQYQQRTGSRCFEAQAFVAKQERFKDTTPTAIDLFKETHYSKKRGFSDQVKQAIVDMESIIDQPVENGEQPKTCTEAVSLVLPKNSTFLENVGLKIAFRKKSRIDVSSQVERLQSELDAKTQESAGLREEVNSLSQEIDNLKRSSTETNALLRQLISFSAGGLDGTNRSCDA